MQPINHTGCDCNPSTTQEVTAPINHTGSDCNPSTTQEVTAIHPPHRKRLTTHNSAAINRVVSRGSFQYTSISTYVHTQWLHSPPLEQYTGCESEACSPFTGADPSRHKDVLCRKHFKSEWFLIARNASFKCQPLQKHVQQPRT